MAVISPFRGVRFNNKKINEIKSIVDSSGNSVSKNLPNIPELFDIAYHHSDNKEDLAKQRQVQELFDSWMAEEILIQESTHCLYLHKTNFTHPSGKTLTKLALICLVRIEDIEENFVKPHKKTSQQITKDSISFLQNAKAQFNPVSALFSDRGNIVFDLLQTEQKQHLLTLEGDKGSEHYLWKIEQPDIINSVQHFFENKEIYLTEGHETYNAVINNKLFLQETDSTFSSSHPANYFMVCLSQLENKDFTILPTHLLVHFPDTISLNMIVDNLQRSFKITCFNQGTRENVIVQILNRMDELDAADSKKQHCSIGIYHPNEDCGLLVEKVAASSVSQIDTNTLTREILPNILDSLDTSSELNPLIQYFIDADEALDICVKKSISSFDETQLLFLMNPVRVEQIITFADSNELMPLEATYFFPKTNVCPLIHHFKNGEITDDVFMESVGE